MSCKPKRNLTRQECEANYGQIKAFALDETNTGLSYASAATEAAWITKINAALGERLYIPIPEYADEATRNVEDAVIQTGNTGKTRKIRDGKVDYILRFDAVDFDAVERLKTLDGATLYGYALTDSHIIAKDNGTNIIPFPVTVYVGEPMSPETRDGSWSINLYVNIVPTDDYFQKAIETTDFSPTELAGINDVTLTVISSDVSDQKVIIDVTGQSGEPIVNLTTSTDWSVYLSAGSVARTITGVTNVGNRYTLTVTDLTAALHGATLKNQPTMTVKGIECQTPVTFTPVA